MKKKEEEEEKGDMNSLKDISPSKRDALRVKEMTDSLEGPAGERSLTARPPLLPAPQHHCWIPSTLNS